MNDAIHHFVLLAFAVGFSATGWFMARNPLRVYRAFAFGKVHSLQTYVRDIAGHKEQEARNAEKFLNHRLAPVRRWADIEIASAMSQAKLFRAQDDKFRD
jgi:hypothetical protein